MYTHEYGQANLNEHSLTAQDSHELFLILVDTLIEESGEDQTENQFLKALLYDDTTNTCTLKVNTAVTVYYIVLHHSYSIHHYISINCRIRYHYNFSTLNH